MKTFITILLIITCLSTASYAQNSPGKELKLKPKSKMRTTGIVLVSTGLVTFASGIVIGVETGGFSYEYSNTNGRVTEKGKPINGVAGVLTILGASATACGVVFTIIGHNKIKKQKKLTLNVLPNSINLCYKF